MKKTIGIAITILLLSVIMIGCKSENQNTNETYKPSDDIRDEQNDQLTTNEQTISENEELDSSKIEIDPKDTQKTDENNTSDPSNQSEEIAQTLSNEDMRNITTMQLVREMGFGINLGNTMEACGDWINSSQIKNYETAWGSPVITEEMIKGYATSGFGVLRIPVAWSNMMSKDGTYTIHPDLMARVKQIVDWSLDNGLYVIINLHWDNGWMQEFPTKKDVCMEKYSRIWEQVSEEFKDYDDYLIFESQNEELGWDSVWNRWAGTKGKKEAYELVNEINQRFVDIVRSSGGNNNLRHLLIAGYNTGVDVTCDPLYIMPNDPAGRLAVSVHYYNPSTLTIIDKDVSWGKARTTWGSDADLKVLDNDIQMLKNRFINNGIPVIVGEYGCFGSNKTRETINQYLTTVSKALYDAKMCPILWNTPNDQYDRQKAEFTDKELLQQLLSALE